MLRPFGHQILTTICWTLPLQAVFVVAIFPFQTLVAQEPLEVEFNLYNLPSCRQTLTKLNSQALVTFDKRPLGECFKTLSAAYQVAIWVDRRVDRSRIVSIVAVGANEVPESKTTLGRIAAVAKLGGCDAGLIENIVYIGPPDQIGAVQRAAARLHNEIMTFRKGLANKAQVELRTLNWEEITTPAELLRNIQEQWSIEIDSELTHDLMHSGTLPSSTLATQLTLLHAGFDLQVDCDKNGTYSTSPLAQESVWKAEYSSKELQTDRLTAARKEFPKATMSVRGKVSTVTGPTGFHLRLLATRVPNPRKTEPARFTIPEIRAPLERVLGDLAKQLGMQVQWSDEIPQSERQAIVNFSVPEAKTTDEIIEQIADENHLKVLIQGQTIEVSPY